MAGRRYRLADLRSDPEAYLEAFTRARSEDRHAICLCSPSGHPAIIDAAVMLTSPSFISAESSHEITMAAALVAARRAFEKPLRYDSTKLVLPDFILIDTPVRTVIEVWGLDDAQYTARMAAKTGHYRERGVILIGWSVGEPLPDVRRPGRRPTTTAPLLS
ncbi:DUF1173 family protein [Nocardia abscessus]|uniref:DUF1173 family protein n=1 Tax=Nocardia abscessus TaxID=120957 RepID=UPI002458BC63|nr:DUF1173 family protein [Nocardia abscessus]